MGQVGNVSSQAKIPPIPEGALGESIRLGLDLVEKTTTHPLSKPYSGNALNCTSCHLKNGTDLQAATFIGVASAYPAWSPRERRVITLEDRILNCFMRSCNGKRPPLGSEVSVSIVTYITWLSSGQPIRMNPDRPLGPNPLPQVSLAGFKADQNKGLNFIWNDVQAVMVAMVWADKRTHRSGANAHITMVLVWLKCKNWRRG
jgi:thiosulfate dehydrogenase